MPAKSGRFIVGAEDGRKRLKTSSISITQLPQVVRGPDALSTAELNRENVVAWGLQVAAMAGDRRLDAADRMFAQKVALLVLQKMIPNASAIDQIDRAEDRRVFRELSGMSKDDLLRMARVTPADLVRAVRERGPIVIDVSAEHPNARAAAEVAEGTERAAQRPRDSATSYAPPLNN